MVVVRASRGVDECFVWSMEWGKISRVNGSIATDGLVV